MNTLSASKAPVLWSSNSKSLFKEQGGGNVYLKTKNTFLEFYNDEDKEIKRSAFRRSFSHDSFLPRENSQGSTACNTSGSGDRSSRDPSSSPSNKSLRSYDDSWMPDGFVNNNHQWIPEADVGFVENNRRQWMPSSHQWATPVMHNNFPQQQGVVQPPPQRKVQGEMNKGTRLVNAKTVPNRKKMDLTKLNPPPSNYSGITTLMIRGIPCSFSQEDLLNLVVSAGLGDTCDFFYLPRAGNTPSNLGYAFINFTETLHAWTCAFTFNGIRLDPAHSSKTCTVSPADIQGIPNLRKHFRRTVVSRGQNGPLFLCDKRNNNLKTMMQRARKM